MAKTLDMMEYANDVAVQAAYKGITHHAVTFVGTAQLDTMVKKFGLSSLLLDGNSDYLTIPDSADWDIVAASGNKTIDFWTKFAADPAGTGTCWLQHTDAEGLNIWFLRQYADSGLNFAVRNNAEWTASEFQSPILDTDLHHVALCVVGANLGIYLDGAQVVWWADFTTVDITGLLYIGATRTPDMYMNGHMDEVRIQHSNVFGAAPNAAKTDTIAVPTAPHQIDADTKLLLHFDGADEATSTIDSSRLEAYSEATIKQQGSYSLKGFAKGTDSLNDYLTHTPGVDLIPEPTNPIFPPLFACETSMIMDGEQCDMWYGGGVSYETLYYTYATDDACIDFAEPEAVLADIRFPYVLKEGDTYYLFAHKSADITGDLFLWSSPDKTTWTIMNDGNPILTKSADPNSIYHNIWNPGVVVIDGVWHMFVECGTQPDESDVGLGYSYSNLTDLNWDTHRTAEHVIDKGGNPHPIHIPDKNSILILCGILNTWWVIKAFYANLADDLAQASSWHEGQDFEISYPDMHTADPYLVVAGPTKNYNIIIQHFYNQRDLYQVYSYLSLNDFFTYIISPTIDLSDLTKIKFDIRASRTGSNIKIGFRDSGLTVTEITPNIIEADVWQTVEWNISGVSNANKDAIDRVIVSIVNADSDNVFYLDNMFGGWPVVIFTKKLGFVLSQVSKLYGTELIKLGFVQTTEYFKMLEHTLKLGFVPSHASTTFGSHALKLGFTPSHTSIVFGLLVKGLGFIPIHEAKVYKFIVELKFYDRDDSLVKIISSKTQNFPLISPGLEFEFLQDGGCGFFGFTTSEDLGLDYNYKCEIYIYETKWFTGYITKLPKLGTKTTYEYRGWGYFEQIDWQTIKETFVGTELSIIAEYILDNYIISKTKVKKAA